jgi:hypothetical protein
MGTKGVILAMTDQTITAIATASIPTIVVILAYFLNRRESQDLRTDIRSDLQLLRSDLGSIRAEILQVRTEFNGKLAQMHADTMTVVKLHTELDKRVTRLEDA